MTKLRQSFVRYIEACYISTSPVPQQFGSGAFCGHSRLHTVLPPDSCQKTVSWLAEFLTAVGWHRHSRTRERKPSEMEKPKIATLLEYTPKYPQIIFKISPESKVCHLIRGLWRFWEVTAHICLLQVLIGFQGMAGSRRHDCVKIRGRHLRILDKTGVLEGLWVVACLVQELFSWKKA